EVEYTGEQVSITRVNGKRIVEVSANFDDDDVSALVQATQKEIEDNFLTNPDNLAGLDADTIEFDFGSETQNQESFESVLIAFPILVLAMYILLAVQFRSFFQPLLILIAVPFSFFGVAVALAATNNPLSFFVMVAFFALIGISVNNSILLTDYANQNRRAGMSPRYAMADALKQRTRPLITTSITSVLALMPLALSDPFWESLAFTLIGGLTASAILVLISFPYYYLGLEALRSRASLKWQNRKSR
ncbi:efflux RND transporter permease subunit, partial [Candidatus Saccharibacteria bacterium]|nr:efflux RND transporter permease subunit [Candidatus Saccharibacteria bacterium]